LAGNLTHQVVTSLWNQMIMVSCGPSRGPKKIKTVSVSSKQSLLATYVVIWTSQEEVTGHRAMQLFRNHDE